MTEAQVLPFRRPDLIVFERFDLEDMAALFRSKQGNDTYFFTLLSDGVLEEGFIQRDGVAVAETPELSDEQSKILARLVRYAHETLKDQLATWHDLGPTEKLSLLIEWANDTVRQLQESIRVAAEHDPAEYAEEISLMCQDIQQHEAYISGLETARSLL
jgi:hypothetical protein